jgi:hypothetical protein
VRKGDKEEGGRGRRRRRRKKEGRVYRSDTQHEGYQVPPVVSFLPSDYHFLNGLCYLCCRFDGHIGVCAEMRTKKERRGERRKRSSCGRRGRRRG